jgi:hypothetical protein
LSTGRPRSTRAAKRLQSLDHRFGAGLLMDDDVPPHSASVPAVSENGTSEIRKFRTSAQ